MLCIHFSRGRCRYIKNFTEGVGIRSSRKGQEGTISKYTIDRKHQREFRSLKKDRSVDNNDPLHNKWGGRLFNSSARLSVFVDSTRDTENFNFNMKNK
jgi:hypothetical protein